MLRATLERFDYPNYRIFVGCYRNDPATAAAIASVKDDRIEPVQLNADGPTTKAHCLNRLYDALVVHRLRTTRPRSQSSSTMPRTSFTRSNLACSIG